MNRLQDVSLGRILVLFFFLLLAATPAFALNYKQPAFISNLYFCNNLVQKGNSLQPDTVVSTIAANDPKAAVHLVVDLVGNKGVHNLEVELLDMNGVQLPITLKFKPWSAANDDSIFRLTNRLAGTFPAGGIFLKVYDTLDNGNKTLLGVFRTMTVQIAQKAPAASSIEITPKKNVKTKAK
ncbi:MAG: hypothetical protein A2521_06300 [Deltaproteobacteria bacterium RIFOXYD12_FULL_57_12]|nr:MAG: hypothetical protein A2521_06300 [Deltaproteobacteria bacterium RIFOXYD12_FULL_57_12]